MLSDFKCPLCGISLTVYSGSDNCNFKCSSLDCHFTSSLKEAIDISYKNGTGAAKGLSNLAPYKFIFDKIECTSFESFIQSLRVKDPDMQKEVCSFPALFCYSIRLDLNDWRKDKTVYWKGNQINRLSMQYSELMSSAYDALFEQSPTFRHLLQSTTGKLLLHSTGCVINTETLLTPKEYLDNLERLRKLL